MALEIERIGTERYQQPMGMLAQFHVLDRAVGPGDCPKWVLNPSFQRGAVWTKAQKIAWIETILRGLGLPAIIVNRFPKEHPTYGWSEVVIDGQQRLRATAEFMQSKFKVRGEYYGQQSMPFQRNWVMASGLSPVVYCAFATERECAELYLKLLTAGTAHTSKEIEKARTFIEECEA
jgi:hypothetical protein